MSRKRRHGSSTVEIPGLDGTVLRVKPSKMMSVQTEEGIIQKLAADLNPGDVLVAAQYREAPSISFQELKRILKENSPEYRVAYDKLYREIQVGGENYEVTLFSHILVQGMYPELKHQGIVSDLEELAMVHSEGIENHPEAENIVMAAIEEAIDLWDSNPSKDLSAAKSTIRDWVRGNTMMSKKDGLYKALASYDPVSLGRSQITERPRWSEFLFWESEQDIKEAWQTVVCYRQVLSKKIREMECVKVEDMPEDFYEGFGEGQDKEKNGTRNNINLENVLPKIGLVTPKTATFVVKKEPKSVKSGVNIPRNISVIETMHLPQNELSVSDAIREAADLRLIMHEVFKHYLLMECNEYGSSSSYDQDVFIASYKVATENVPNDIINQHNYDYTKMMDRPYGLNWTKINEYARVIEKGIKKSGLHDLVMQHFDLREEETKDDYSNVLSSIFLNNIPQEYNAIYNQIGKQEFERIYREAYFAQMARISGYREKFSEMQHVFDRLRQLQPWIPQRFIAMSDLTHRLFIDENLITPEERELYEDMLLTEGERTQYQRRINSLHDSLKRDYDDPFFPGMDAQVIKIED